MNKYITFILVLVFFTGSCGNNEKTNKYIQGYDEPVRGVWLTNVASDALFSNENIKEAVEYCDELDINTIFVVTWNKGMTTYRSNVMKKLTGTEIDPALDSGNAGRDPLEEVITEAKKYGIKVFAWFEFGFASSHNANGGEILEKKPGWASKDADGNLCTKNGFEWMNAMDSEVQDFMISLILEVVNNYDIDGIQGDDRLPAMPSEGGYNKDVADAYKEDHHGEEPPSYHKDFNWVQWRSEELNDFMKRLYTEVKEADSNCIVSMAPSVYPWSKAEYLQDWPRWVNFGYVDMISPQIYRKDSVFYKKTLEETIEYLLPGKRHLLYPGLLIRSGEYQPSEQFFQYMIQKNRNEGLEGEIFFFYEGMKDYEDNIKKLYKN